MEFNGEGINIEVISIGQLGTQIPRFGKSFSDLIYFLGSCVDCEKIMWRSFQSKKWKGRSFFSISPAFQREKNRGQEAGTESTTNVTQVALPSASTMIAVPCRCQTVKLSCMPKAVKAQTMPLRSVNKFRSRCLAVCRWRSEINPSYRYLA